MSVTHFEDIPTDMMGTVAVDNLAVPAQPGAVVSEDRSYANTYPLPGQSELYVYTHNQGEPLNLAQIVSGGPAMIEAAKRQVASESEAADRSQEVYALSRNPNNYYEIDIASNVTLEQRQARTDPEVWNFMLKQVEPWVGKTVYWLSSTYEGGGVAMQEPPKIDFLRQLGVDVHWLVSEPDDKAFMVTKKMHNLQQDVLEDKSITFTREDMDIHTAYGQKNVMGMLERVPGLQTADAVWMEDPQLAGGLSLLMAVNPTAKFVYRNHINTDRDKMATTGSPQWTIKEYLHEECMVGRVNTYVAHPIEGFVPYGTENVAYQPPVSDEFEDLSIQLSPEQKAAKFASVNRQIERQNKERQLHNLERFGLAEAHRDDQAPLPMDRHWITGFARFDYAKNQVANMELQLLIMQKLAERGAPPELIPQMVIAGNGATDDPDRLEVINMLLDLRSTKYAAIKDYITIIGLDHDYQVPNALLDDSMYGINLSTKEGWEHRKTEAILKGTPAISSDAGGLPKQGEDGVGGNLVVRLADQQAELERIAGEIVEDIINPERYAQRVADTREFAREFSERELMTVANLIREMRILSGRGDRTWLIGEIMAAEAQAYLEEVARLGEKALA